VPVCPSHSPQMSTHGFTSLEHRGDEEDVPECCRQRCSTSRLLFAAIPVAILSLAFIVAAFSFPAYIEAKIKTAVIESRVVNSERSPVRLFRLSFSARRDLGPSSALTT